MTAPIAVRASYSDFKLLKTRSVYQIILEAPIEQAEDFVTAFGLPIPGAERPVALALLNPSAPLGAAPDVMESSRQPAEPQALPQAEGGERAASREKPQRDPTNGRPDRVTQWFGIACGEPRFQAWIGQFCSLNIGAKMDRDTAAEVVRQLCGVKSRAEFASNPIARQKALDLMADYEAAAGQMAEDRS